MKLYWVDVESTGLNPQQDDLLELAIAEADLSDPFEIGPICNPVFRFRREHTYAPGCSIAGLGHENDRCDACERGSRPLSPFIVDMHTKSGLLEACERSTTRVAEIEEHLLTLVPEVADKDNRPTLAGSTVHFDHAFLRAKMPRLAARFSHRHYDVSAVKLFCESLGMPRIAKKNAHRAHADILESIEHARTCAEWLRGGDDRRRLRSLLDHVTRFISENGYEGYWSTVLGSIGYQLDADGFAEEAK